MGLDIRKPLGLMFLAVGALMVLYGAFTMGSPMYTRSVGVNINLWWGLVMLAFGALMYGLSWRARR